jgi:hypothetical protein
LIIVPALILVTSTALPPGHFFYPASNQPHSVQTGLAVIFDNFLPIPDDRGPVIETRFCLNSDHYYSAIMFRNFGNIMGGVNGYKSRIPFVSLNMTGIKDNVRIPDFSKLVTHTKQRCALFLK